MEFTFNNQVMHLECHKTTFNFINPQTHKYISYLLEEIKFPVDETSMGPSDPDLICKEQDTGSFVTFKLSFVQQHTFIIN